MIIGTKLVSNWPSGFRQVIKTKKHTMANITLRWKLKIEQNEPVFCRDFSWNTKSAKNKTKNPTKTATTKKKEEERKKINNLGRYQ